MIPGDAVDDAVTYQSVVAADGTSAGVAWSADGSLLAATRKVGEESADVFLVDTAGRVVRRLTSGAAYDGSPAFSPDGSQVAFYSDGGEFSDLVVAAVDGSERPPMTLAGGPGCQAEARWRPR